MYCADGLNLSQRWLCFRTTQLHLAGVGFADREDVKLPPLILIIIEVKAPSSRMKLLLTQLAEITDSRHLFLSQHLILHDQYLYRHSYPVLASSTPRKRGGLGENCARSFEHCIQTPWDDVIFGRLKLVEAPNLNSCPDTRGRVSPRGRPWD